MSRIPYDWGCWCMLATLLSLFSIPSIAQDPSFSQFYANRVYLNPAFVGLESGLTVTGAARMQWLRVDRGFRTYGMTVETQMPVVRLGLGFHLLRNEEGIGNLTTNQVGLALSYTIPGKKDNIHFGFEGKVVQKTIDWDRFLFSDQLDPVYGVVQPTSMVPVLDRVMYGDLDFGVVWRHEGDLRIRGKSMQKIRSHLGISFHHLPYLLSKSAEGNDSFLNLDSRVAPRTTIHGGMIIPITFLTGTGMDIAFSPNIKLDMQGYKFMSVNENLMVGTLGFYTLVNSFYMGVLYQNRIYAPNHFHTDAFILTFGGYMNTDKRSGGQQPALFFGVSADLNSTGVGPAAGSVFELTFRYRFMQDLGFGSGKNGRRGGRNRILDCKSFF